MPIVLVHLDERIVVLDKPAGLASVPGLDAERRPCVATEAALAWPGARIVHRLDQATSGIMVLARDAEAHRELSVQFERRAVEKRYEAIVAGVPRVDEGTIDLPLRKDLTRRARHVIDMAQGRRAITRWRVLEADEDAARSRLRLEPLTGRSHQLRIHCAAIGHPILGDEFYAPPAVAAASPTLRLRATLLAFVHPGSGERVSFGVPA